MSEIMVRERFLRSGKKVYEYSFEMASVDGKRKRKSKSGFASKRDARIAGRKALSEYENVGQVIRVHVDFVGDGGAAQIRIGKMRTDIVLDDADRVRGIGGQVLFHIQPLFLIPCIFFHLLHSRRQLFHKLIRVDWL